MIPTAYSQQPLGVATNRSGSSRASSRGGGRRRKELEQLIFRVQNLETEIEDVRHKREMVEDELEATRSKFNTTGLPPRMPKKTQRSQTKSRPMTAMSMR